MCSLISNFVPKMEKNLYMKKVLMSEHQDFLFS